MYCQVAWAGIFIPTRAVTCATRASSSKLPGSPAHPQEYLACAITSTSSQSYIHKAPHTQLRTFTENLVPNALGAILVTMWGVGEFPCLATEEIEQYLSEILQTASSLNPIFKSASLCSHLGWEFSLSAKAKTPMGFAVLCSSKFPRHELDQPPPHSFLQF